jgi:outer membrane protein TolC
MARARATNVAETPDVAPRTYDGKARIVPRSAPVAAVVLAAVLGGTARGVHMASLQSLVDEALRSNPEVLAARERVVAGKARVPQVASLDDPQFRVMWMNISGEPPMSLTPNDLQYRVSLALPFPGKRALRAELARKDVGIAREAIRSVERDVIRQVKAAYFDVWLAEKRRDVNAFNTEQVRGLLETVEARYATGKAALSDVLTLQNELAVRLNNDPSFRDERRAALARLNLLLNRHPSTPVETAELDHTDIPEWKHSREELEMLAAANRPELRQSEIAIAQGDTALALARAQYRPDFMVMLDRQPGQIRTGGFDFMLMINLPFLFRKKYDYGLAEAQANLAAAQQGQQAIRNAIVSEIETVFVGIEAGHRLVRLYDDVLLPQAQDAYEAALTGYQTGAVDFVRLVNALTSIQELRLGYYAALANLLKQIADMERTVGTDL